MAQINNLPTVHEWWSTESERVVADKYSDDANKILYFISVFYKYLHRDVIHFVEMEENPDYSTEGLMELAIRTTSNIKPCANSIIYHECNINAIIYSDGTCVIQYEAGVSADRLAFICESLPPILASSINDVALINMSSDEKQKITANMYLESLSKRDNIWWYVNPTQSTIASRMLTMLNILLPITEPILIEVGKILNLNKTSNIIKGLGKKLSCISAKYDSLVIIGLNSDVIVYSEGNALMRVTVGVPSEDIAHDLSKIPENMRSDKNIFNVVYKTEEYSVNEFLENLSYIYSN